MASCTQCGGAGTLPSGRYEDCYRCGGTGHGAATHIPCMACSGSGRSTTEVRDSCWACHGGGVQHDPAPTAAGSAATVHAGGPESGAASTIDTDTSSAGGAIAGISAVAAAVYGGFERFGRDASWMDAAMAAGIVFVLCLIALHLLYGLLRFLLDLAKVAVPVAALIAVGYWLEWGWAQDAVEILGEAWTGVSSFVDRLWSKVA